MAKQIVPVVTTTGTGSTTDITYSGLGASTNIDGAIIWITGCTAEDTDTSDIQLSTTYYDGTDLVNHCFSDQDASENTVVSEGRRSDKVGIMQVGAQAFESLGTLSKIADGVRITWDSGLEPQSSWKVQAVLFAGGIDVKVDIVQLNTTVDGSTDMTVSSAPDIVFVMWGYIGIPTSIPSVNSDTINHQMGVCVNDGSLTQHSVMSFSDGGRISGQYESRVQSDLIRYSTTNAKQVEVTGISSSAVTFTNRNSTANCLMGVMAIGGLADVALSIGDTDFDTDTSGSQSITGVGFQPDFAMTCRERATNLDTEYTNLNQEFKIGICDDTDESCFSTCGDDGSAQSDVHQRFSAGKFLDSYQGEGEAIQGTFTSFDTGGMTLNVSSAGVSNGWILMIQTEAGGPPATDDSVPWMSMM